MESVGGGFNLGTLEVSETGGEGGRALLFKIELT